MVIHIRSAYIIRDNAVDFEYSQTAKYQRIE